MRQHHYIALACAALGAGLVAATGGSARQCAAFVAFAALSAAISDLAIPDRPLFTVRTRRRPQ